MNTIENFKNAIRDTGLFPPDHIPAGRIIAFPGYDKKPGNKAARCFLFPDLRGGWFQDFSTGLYQVWLDKTKSNYSAEERAEFKRRCDEAREKSLLASAKTHRYAAAKAGKLWKQSKRINNQSEHLYLVTKRIKPHVARLKGNCLVIPMTDNITEKRLTNLQFIDPEGNKRFLSGGKKKGCFSVIGNWQACQPVLICEGYATGASLHEHTGHLVIVAMDAGNLKPVAQTIRKVWPDSPIIVCGDNDTSGVGQVAAEDAARACGGTFNFPKTPDFDWNDALANGGA